MLHSLGNSGEKSIKVQVASAVVAWCECKERQLQRRVPVKQLGVVRPIKIIVIGAPVVPYPALYPKTDKRCVPIDICYAFYCYQYTICTIANGLCILLIAAIA